MDKSNKAVTGEGNAPRATGICGPINEIPTYAQVTAQRDELLAALKGVFDIVENEIGYRTDSESEHERMYANRMITARAAIAKAEQH